MSDQINRLYLNISWIVGNRLTRFAVVGLSGLFLDLGGLYFLHTLLGWLLTPSAIISTEIAIINNFLWNDLWTFSDVSSQHNSGTQKLQRFCKFNLICLVGMILNILIVNLLFYQFGVNEYIAKLLAILGVTWCNFGINLRLNWQATETEVVILPDKDKEATVLGNDGC